MKGATMMYPLNELVRDAIGLVVFIGVCLSMLGMG